MEISGSLFPPSPYTGIDPADKYPQQRPPPPQVSPPATPVKQTIRAEAQGDDNRQRRFYSLDRDMSHSARQAINRYQDSDFAGEPELMSRVDVYA